nr:unnamed protein product [Callosobruchus analis]
MGENECVYEIASEAMQVWWRMNVQTRLQEEATQGLVAMSVETACKRGHAGLGGKERVVEIARGSHVGNGGGKCADALSSATMQEKDENAKDSTAEKDAAGGAATPTAADEVKENGVAEPEGAAPAVEGDATAAGDQLNESALSQGEKTPEGATDGKVSARTSYVIQCIYSRPRYTDN